MPWFKVDDGFHGHPKVLDLSLGAIGLWTISGSWCAKYLTDGLVPYKMVTRFDGTEAEADELVRQNLWIPSDDGYQFKGWAEYQPMKDEVEAEREAARERMRAVRAAKKGVPKKPKGGSLEHSDERSPERADELPEKFDAGSKEVRIAPSQSQSLSHPSPSTSNEVDISATDWFEITWAEWPKKVDKKDAAKKWPHAVKAFGGSEEELSRIAIEHARLYAHHDKQFIPGFLVWMNKERWNNELPTAGSSAPGTRKQTAAERAYELSQEFKGVTTGGYLTDGGASNRAVGY